MIDIIFGIALISVIFWKLNSGKKTSIKISKDSKGIVSGKDVNINGDVNF